MSIRDESTQVLFRRLLLLQVILSGLASVNGSDDQQKNFYIVYMGDSPSSLKDSIVESHVNLLSSVVGSVGAAKDSIVHSYINNFNAFAAKLSPNEAKMLERSSSVISVFPNQYRKLHTTKSWDFMGFNQNVKRNLKLESNIVVGLLDTGITPGSESFSDKGLGPPPAKWKGTCGPFANFSGCNNKLVGARFFKLDGNPDPTDIMSPVDVEGHGSHTSSTVVGNVVNGADLFGLAKGTARGAVPSARVAMYKVCWASSGCSDMDLLAGFDAAIEDGVDVISVSIGGSSESYLRDPIAIGAFHAMKKGIITVASAGNEGPGLSSVVNHAPWILTVAASGIDRQFRSKIMLGNGKLLSGIGINTFTPKQRLYPLISGADAGFNSSVDPSTSSMYCMGDSLDPKKVKGKVVLCELQQWGADSVVKKAGGTGTLLESSINPDTAQIFMAPGTMINYSIAKDINDYISSTRSPSAVIYRTQEVKVSAPFVASFSSRGPSMGSRHVLKPDITAPGIDILAAYTPLKSLTGLDGDKQYSKFTIMSGTSMSCPHVAGVAAYVKSFHPAWSPAAIKSAIITTAKPMSPKVNVGAEFSYGAGLLNPIQAVHPGLIYDMDQLPYIQFLCFEGYKDDPIRVIVGSRTVNCSELPPAQGSDALNYPTMQLSMKTSDKKPGIAVFRRRVTNVGPAKSIYNATINAPKNVEITVNPTNLVFTRRFQKRSFKVVVKAKTVASEQEIQSGSLVWRSDIHTVRSPIVVFTSDYF
ncbi:Peptidase S8/S53 domain [Macleaya cordata]|uniref:Peptidase S8/S53 domain n=1 Tax=Macleaya cordata TaxID=56857 RepID=A0A200PPK5_MACCD|nr:Peptidase S8/S53 domain [Macleaya cordata]